MTVKLQMGVVGNSGVEILLAELLARLGDYSHLKLKYIFLVALNNDFN